MYSRNLITKFLKDDFGTSISYISKKEKISVYKIYNFVKGLSRDETIEMLLINNYHVPKSLIELTFQVKGETDAAIN